MTSTAATTAAFSLSDRNGDKGRTVWPDAKSFDPGEVGATIVVPGFYPGMTTHHRCVTPTKHRHAMREGRFANRVALSPTPWPSLALLAAGRDHPSAGPPADDIPQKLHHHAGEGQPHPPARPLFASPPSTSTPRDRVDMSRSWAAQRGLRPEVVHLNPRAGPRNTSVQRGTRPAHRPLRAHGRSQR